jgi:hypothetical protein
VVQLFEFVEHCYVQGMARKMPRWRFFKHSAITK